MDFRFRGNDRIEVEPVIFGLDPEIQGKRNPCNPAGPNILDSRFHGNDKRKKAGMTIEKNRE